MVELVLVKHNDTALKEEVAHNRPRGVLLKVLSDEVGDMGMVREAAVVALKACIFVKMVAHVKCPVAVVSVFKVNELDVLLLIIVLLLSTTRVLSLPLCQVQTICSA